MTASTPYFAPLFDAAVIMTAGSYGLLAVIAFHAGLFGIWLLVLVGLSLWRYAYAVLRGVAQGRPELPPPSIESMNPVGELGLSAHFLLFPALIAAIDHYLPPGFASMAELLGSLLIVGLLLVFPASAAIMGLSGSLLAALNPTEIGSVIKTLGRDYAVLIVACAVLAILAELVESLIVPHFGFLAELAGAVVAIWAALGMFAIVGASIRRHRDDFVIPGERAAPIDREAEALDKRRRAELDLAYAALRSGETEKGYTTLRKLIADHGGSTEIQWWLFENMIDWEDRSHAFRVAARLIARLVEIGDMPAALELYRRCRRLGGRPEVSAGSLGLLARYAREIGQTGLASEISVDADGGEDS